jgi:hypothetical protein
MGLYRAKCLPQVLDIIARARRMRKNHPLLRSIYLLTDAHGPWLDEVRMWLDSEGWDHVWVGREDIYPRWREREVGVAVDMEVARRAGVFVGNGVSEASERGERSERVGERAKRKFSSSCLVWLGRRLGLGLGSDLAAAVVLTLNLVLAAALVLVLALALALAVAVDPALALALAGFWPWLYHSLPLAASR